MNKKLKFFIKLILIEIYLFANFTVNAEWIQSNCAFGGYISCLAVKDSIILAGTFSDVYMSTNHGKNWKSINYGQHFGTISALLIKDSFIFIITSKQMFRTSNYGLYWCEIGKMNSYSYNCIAESGKNIVVGTSKGLLISTDNGTNWKSLKDIIPDNTYIMSIVAKDSILFVAVAFYGVYYSNNLGKTWISGNYGLSSAPSILYLNNNILYAGKGDKLYMSSDTSIKWNQICENMGDIMAVCVLKDTVYVGTVDGIIKSSIHVFNWNQLNNGLVNTYVTSVESDDSIIYAGTYGGVFSNSIYSQYWSFINSGLNSTINYDICTNGNKVFIATELNGIFNSDDYGLNWTRKINITNTITAHSIFSNGKYLFAGFSKGISLSKDDGLTWTFLNDTLWSYSIKMMGNNIYIGENHGVSVSKDYGLHWSRVSNGLPDHWVKSIAISGSDIYVESIYTYISQDSGLNWRPLVIRVNNVNHTVVQIVSSGSMIIAYCDNNNFLSNDFGKTWEKMNIDGAITNSDAVAIYNPDKTKAKYIIYYNNGNIIVTTNDYSNRIDASEGLIKNISIMKLMICGNYLLAMTYQNGVWIRPIAEIINKYNNINRTIDLEFNIYPNPVKNILNINLPSQNVNIEIIDIQGMVVKKEFIQERNAQLNINNLKQGIYFIKLFIKDGILVKKFIKY